MFVLVGLPYLLPKTAKHRKKRKTKEMKGTLCSAPGSPYSSFPNAAPDCISTFIFPPSSVTGPPA